MRKLLEEKQQYSIQQEENLIIKAAMFLRNNFNNCVNGVDIHLDKRIPIGAGLAGTEAAWQVAQAGLKVTLIEMRPVKQTPAHHSSEFAELVCSNSFGALSDDRAAGLLQQELKYLKSLVTIFPTMFFGRNNFINF